MTQELKLLASNHDRQILCYYFNATTNIQLARLKNIQNGYFERVVFPKQRLLFEALPNAHLEIQTRMLDSEIISDKISCNLLRVKEGLSCFLDNTHEARGRSSAAL